MQFVFLTESFSAMEPRTVVWQIGNCLLYGMIGFMIYKILTKKKKK